MHSQDLNPKLAAPGAGISAGEMFILNWLVKPFALRNHGLNAAVEALHSSAEEILEEVQTLSQGELLTRVLVDRPLFVEDSSRHWSAAMLCRHLSKIDSALAKGIERAFEAKQEALPKPSDRLAAMKPEIERNETSAIEEFKNSVLMLSAAVAKHSENDLKRRTLAHPWLGDISHLQWIWFAGLHHKVHLRQLERIVAHLRE